MPRRKKPVPPYSHHKPTDRAYVRVPDGNGGRSAIYLGKYGSPESRAEYQRVLAEMMPNPTPAASQPAAMPPESLPT